MREETCCELKFNPRSSFNPCPCAGFGFAGDSSELKSWVRGKSSVNPRCHSALLYLARFRRTDFDPNPQSSILNPFRHLKMTKPSSSPNHYEVLSLPLPHTSTPPITAHKLKAAYHRALLRHHPDKSSALRTPSGRCTKPAYTIDQITHAYTTLLDPATRSAYDHSIFHSGLHQPVGSFQAFPSTDEFRSEVLDLEELSYKNDEGIWYRECRCGLEKGFVVKEQELESAAEDGAREMLVGCAGCSLWITVGFGVVDCG